MKSLPTIVAVLGLCMAGMADCKGTGAAVVDSEIVAGEVAITLYVADHTVSCVGEGPRECLLVREDPSQAWSYFYDAIEGFTYEPGYTYTLRVAVRTVPNPPADGSSRAYRLLQIVSTQRS